MTIRDTPRFPEGAPIEGASAGSLLAAVQAGVEVFDLAQPLTEATPHSPNAPPFRLSLLRRHGDVVRDDGGSFAADLIVTGGHTGTHVDALGHVSHEGRVYGGAAATHIQTGGRLMSLGIDQLEPIVCRGVLLDVAAVHGTEVLPGGYAITADDLAAAEAAAGVDVRAGDAVLIRSGWGCKFGDAAGFVGLDSGVPGPVEEAADWLADRGVRATGAETIAYERIEPGVGHQNMHVHRVLLVERGIPIIEMMRLDQLAAAGVHEFVLVLAPLRIVGGTGSPVRPLALVDGGPVPPASPSVA